MAIEAFFQNIHKIYEEKIEENWVEIILDLLKSDSNMELIIDSIENSINTSEVLRKHFGSPEYMEHENEELRHRLLYNSHLFLETLGEEYFAQNIFEHYQNLMKDENETIRSRLAETAHEIAKNFGIIGSYLNGFHKCIITFMADKSPTVQGTLLLHLDVVAKLLLPSEITEEHEENDIHK